MEGTLMDFDVRMTLPGLGAHPANGEAVLDGLMALAPDVDPVVSQALDAGTLSVSISCDAADSSSAAKAATGLLERVLGSFQPETVDVQVQLTDAA